MNQTKSISLVSPRAGRWLAVAAVVTSMAVLGGCANRSASSGVYSYDQAQREQIVRTGTVTGVRPIVIQNDKSSGAGMLAGGALGGVAGNAVGGGTGRTIATVGGAIWARWRAMPSRTRLASRPATKSRCAWTTAKPVSWPRKPMCPSASANASR